eukprot:2845061-Alexandrium_andersonii.AAC.1
MSKAKAVAAPPTKAAFMHLASFNVFAMDWKSVSEVALLEPGKDSKPVADAKDVGKPAADAKEG